MPEAHSQPAAHAQGSAGSAEAAQEHPDHSDEDEELLAGSGATLVAPADPKARDPWLRDKLTFAITSRPLLARAKIAVAVVDLATGGELYSHDADKGLNLASNTKLL